MKLNQIAFALVATLGVVGAVHAGVDGASSNYSYIDVGPVTSTSHPDGAPAISVVTATSPYDGFTGLNSLKSLSAVYGTNTDITVSTESFNLSSIPSSAIPHAGLGNFTFAKINDIDDDVFFGEWYATGDTVSGSSRTVYYAGDNTNTTVPTSGTATYVVAGVNNGLSLSGTFGADFGAGTLAGTLTGSGTVTSLTIDAGFDVGDSAFDGSATAVGTYGTDTSGEVVGSFFGANAASLAGIASFNTTAYDTAFGGVKQ